MTLGRNDDSSVNPLKFRERDPGGSSGGGLEDSDKLNEDINGEHEESETVMEELILFIKPGLKELIGSDEKAL